MNTIILELDVAEIPQVDLSEDGVININLLGVDYEVKLSHTSIRPSADFQVTYCPNPINYPDACRMFVDNRKLILKGYAVDKKAKELCEAKEFVRKKQQDFKDAQRKLSELMGN